MIVYCCFKCLNLVYWIVLGYKLVNLGEGEKGIKNILLIKIFIFDLVIFRIYFIENINSFNFLINLLFYFSLLNYNIIVLYLGFYSKIELVLVDFSGICCFFLGFIEIVNYFYEYFNVVFLDYSI